VLEPTVRDLSEVLAALARELGDRETRQRAVDGALKVANAVSGADAPARRWRLPSRGCAWLQQT
jgi:hypothetical protein